MQAPSVGGVRLPRGNGEVIRLARGASLSDFAEKIDANPAALVQALQEEVSAYPNVREIGSPRWATWDEPPLLVPVIIEVENAVLSMFTTLTTFGTPRDVTLDELAVELFFPGDDETDAILRGAP